MRDAGGYNDWPNNRGIFLSHDKRFLSWVHEEEHLRFISMQEGGNLAEVYRRLVKVYTYDLPRYIYATNSKKVLDDHGSGIYSYRFSTFYTPVFRRDVLWYGDVRPGLRPTLRPSVRPGLRPPIFRTFLLYALTYWAEILHMTLFWCTTDQVRLSSLCVNVWRSCASLWT